MKEFAYVSFTDELALRRASIFVETHKGKAILLEGELTRVMMSNGDIYYFLTEKNKRRIMKEKHFRMPIVS